MLLSYLIFLVLAIVVFLLGRRWPFWARSIVALMVFLVPSAVATVWVAKVGDSAPPGAITIQEAPK
jgi:hypothetical protein